MEASAFIAPNVSKDGLLCWNIFFNKKKYDLIWFVFVFKIFHSMTFLVSFNKCVACHLKPVLPTFYDECKGGDFQLKLSLPLQQKVQWVQALAEQHIVLGKTVFRLHADLLNTTFEHIQWI